MYLAALTGPKWIFLFDLFDGRDELVLLEQEHEVPEVHGDHDQRLVPHDHVVDGDDGQHGYGGHVDTAVADQRPPFHGYGPAGGQTGERRDAQGVVHPAAHHRAHADVRLGEECSDHGDEQFRRARGRRHESRPGHVRRNA